MLIRWEHSSNIRRGIYITVRKIIFIHMKKMENVPLEPSLIKLETSDEQNHSQCQVTRETKSELDLDTPHFLWVFAYKRHCRKVWLSFIWKLIPSINKIIHQKGKKKPRTASQVARPSPLQSPPPLCGWAYRPRHFSFAVPLLAQPAWPSGHQPAHIEGKYCLW